MAESDREDRTESASPKRLEEARNNGQIPRSRELSTALVTIASALAMWTMGSQFAQGFAQLLRHGLSAAVLADTAAVDMPNVFYSMLVNGLMLVWPLFAVVFLASLLASVLLGGWTFNYSLKFSKLNPMSGLGNLFSAQSLVELGKSILKVIFIGSAAYILLSHLMNEILMLDRQNPDAGMMRGAGMISHFFVLVSLPLILIAMIDVPWQLFSFHKGLRMTRQELVDEHKDSEGRPEVKAKIRRMQQAMSKRRMMEAVPKADVIITNPTHFAVALKYDEARGGAPTVVAKGADEVALVIRSIGQEHQVMLVESRRLARALYASTDIGREIPAGLYLAVAQILTYVYQLRQWQALGGDYPSAPEPVVDDVFLKDLMP